MILFKDNLVPASSAQLLLSLWPFHILSGDELNDLCWVLKKEKKTRQKMPSSLFFFSLWCPAAGSYIETMTCGDQWISLCLVTDFSQEYQTQMKYFDFSLPILCLASHLDENLRKEVVSIYHPLSKAVTHIIPQSRKQLSFSRFLQ